MKTRAFTAFFLTAALVFSGCGRTKELERENREQARVIAELQSEVARLQADLDRSKQARPEAVRAKTDLRERIK